MKNLLAMLAMSAMVTTFVACDEDDPTFELPTIEIVNTTLEQRAGEVIEVNASVFADAGIKTISVSVDNGTAEDITGDFGDDEVALVTYDFTVPADAVEGET